ncbi:unnamed protein product [Amaranthus hypochondriacus]
MAVALSRARNDQLHLQKFKDKQDNLDFHHHSTMSMIDHNQTQKRVSVAFPSHYSWSSKRSYKNGYVWHDLEENDLIHPVHGGEYILKGSEILVETVSNSSDTLSSTSTGNNIPVTVESEFPVTRNRWRNQSCGSIEYQMADIFTKALPPAKHGFFRMQLGVCNFESSKSDEYILIQS